jgi:hypothetical protein
MKRTSVLLFSICLLGISLYGLSNDTFYVSFLINLGTLSAYLRIGLVAALVAYAFVPSVRLYLAKVLLGIGGIIMLSLGIICIGSPSLFGQFNSYMLIGDALTLIEGGILATVLSIELESRKSKLMIWSFAHLQLLFATRTRKLTYFSPLHHSEKVLKTQLHLKPIISADRLINNLKYYQTDHKPLPIGPHLNLSHILKS